MLDLEKYAGPIYSWCLRRTANVFDAQDLSQEILFEIFRSFKNTQVREPDAWVWRIARNRYARRIAGRRQWIPIDDTEPLAAPEAEDMSAQDAAFRALHSIAASHREVLSDHYVLGISCDEIARKRGLDPATVRTRLYYGRRKLKRRWDENMSNNRIFDRLDWHVSGNGDVDISYLDRQIARAIVSACYEQWRDVEDIGDITGIPCMYIEDELRRLESGEIVIRKGKKYISNIVVHSRGYLEAAEKVLMLSANELADAFSAAILSAYEDIRRIGFHGSGAPVGVMGWWLLPLVMRAACNGVRENIDFERGGFLPRQDGGKGWLFADEAECGVRKYYSGCNRYYLENSRFRYFWTWKYLSDGLAALLRRLEDVDEPFSEPALAAECVRCGVAAVKNGGVAWNIPVFSPAQFAEMSALAARIARPLAKKLSPLAEKLLDILRKDTPKHLHEQLKGIFGADFNAIIAMMGDVMEDNGRLARPEGEIFGGQVIMIR